MPKKISTTTCATQTINNIDDDKIEVIPGYTKKALQDIGFKIVCYRKTYYVDNREYILTNVKLRYHQLKMNNEPIITPIERYINTL